jgi:hypothetical protein
MPKRSSRLRQDGPNGDDQADPILAAARIFEQVTGEVFGVNGLPPGTKNPAAVALGRLGGKKGGPARAKALSANKRRAIAKRAARARWNRAKNR